MGLFGFGSSPADAGMGYLDQISGMAHQNLDPYINRGSDQYAGLNKQYAAMGQDPTAFLNQMMRNYQPSQGYQLQRDEAQRAAGNTAAAGGMRGSLQDITNQSRLTDSLMGQDMQQWLGNVMGIQNQGLQGQQGFYNQGYQSSQQLTDMLANMLSSKASLGLQGAMSQDAGMNALFGSLIGAGGMAAGGYLGGL